MKATITIDLAENSYPIYIGDDTLSTQLLASHITGKQVLIVSNDTVAQLYLELLKACLTHYDVQTYLLPDGEQYKTLESFNQIISFLLDKKYSRDCTLVALGGGVVGDMTGFVAACYQRGVHLIQVPTTLLAQVDSSVGGKTAVNHTLGKNMIGAFYQPDAVLIDVSVLNSLADREYSAGLAEVIKYGLICDQAFFIWLEENIVALKRRENQQVIYAIEHSCMNKAHVVSVDERESGIRAILNFGHTFGHAIETALSYKGLLHGEAVAIGMMMAADLSVRIGKLTVSIQSRIENILQQAGLPTLLPDGIDLDILYELMKRDKKVKDNKLFLVFLDDIGQAVISSEYQEDQLKETILKFRSV